MSIDTSAMFWEVIVFREALFSSATDTLKATFSAQSGHKKDIDKKSRKTLADFGDGKRT
jgi:hypothetical protein